MEYRRAEPATAVEIADLEKKLGRRLPLSLKEFLTAFSKNLLFDVEYPEDHYPDKFYPMGGYLEISSATIVRDENKRQEWIKDCFPNPDDSYHRIWHDKIGFIMVPTGDFIALDLTDAKDDKRVVYLSHDGDDDINGHVLAAGFGEFMERYINIGQFLPEAWELWAHIPEEGNGYLDPECGAAKEFRRSIGLRW